MATRSSQKMATKNNAFRTLWNRRFSMHSVGFLVRDVDSRQFVASRSLCSLPSVLVFVF